MPEWGAICRDEPRSFLSSDPSRLDQRPYHRVSLVCLTSVSNCSEAHTWCLGYSGSHQSAVSHAGPSMSSGFGGILRYRGSEGVWKGTCPNAGVHLSLLSAWRVAGPH